MKISLRKKTTLDGKTWLHYDEDGLCQKSWNITSDPEGTVQAEAEAYYDSVYQNLLKGVPTEEVLREAAF